MKKGITFTSDDVARWRNAYADDPSFSITKIREGNLDEGRELVDLSRAHEYLALIKIAGGEFSAALGEFGAASDAWAALFERAELAQDIDPSLTKAIPPGVFLFANAGPDRSLNRLVRATATVAEQTDHTRSPSHYLGVVVRALSMGEIDRAGVLLESSPEMPKHNEGFLRALQAIVAGDEEAFKTALDVEVAFWQRTITRERLQHFPDAVCFAQGIGWLKLAERVWKRSLDLVIDNIPAELLNAVPEFIDPGV